MPLGYRVEDRKLIVVPREAETVRDIMRRYLECNSVRTLLPELARDGIVTKCSIARNGKVRGGVIYCPAFRQWPICGLRGGVIDPPALAGADIGIAMGTGTDVAMQSAGVTLLHGDVADILHARRLSGLSALASPALCSQSRCAR